MNKSLIKHSGFTMKRAFTKGVFALCFAFFFVGLGEMNAQTEALAPNAVHEKVASRMNLEILPVESIDYSNATNVLNDQLNATVKGDAITIEYRYYWLVSVDVNRFNVPIEEALLNNLMKVQSEFDASIEDLQTLYQSTVDLL